MNYINPFPLLSTTVASFDLIVIGHLKWNPYFNERPDQPPRGDPSTCTSTLICGTEKNGQPYRLLVDSTLRNAAEDYYFDLNRRTGLAPEDITHCFITHEHFDHQIGASYFPEARWMAAEPVAEKLVHSAHIDGKRVQGVRGEFLPGLFALPLPGHTDDLHGLAFICDGFRVVVAADGVMTRAHYREETTMFERDAVQAMMSIRHLKEIADLVVPGHDNVIVTGNNHMNP